MQIEEIAIGGKRQMLECQQLPSSQQSVPIVQVCQPGIAAEAILANYHRFSSPLSTHLSSSSSSIICSMFSPPVILISVGVVSLVPARFLALQVYHPASPFWIPEITRFPFPTIWNLLAEVRSRNWPSLIHLVT